MPSVTGITNIRCCHYFERARAKHNEMFQEGIQLKYRFLVHIRKVSILQAQATDDFQCSGFLSARGMSGSCFLLYCVLCIEGPGKRVWNGRNLTSWRLVLLLFLLK